MNDKGANVKKFHAPVTGQPGSQMIQYKGATIQLHRVVECAYPEHDRVYLEKKNRKLLVMDISINCSRELSSTDKQYIAPPGAILYDDRGNEYAVSMRVIAMAQGNRCIKGDDIPAYNAIWNASVEPGKSMRAFVLGFDLPSDAVPSQLYWNRDWQKQDLYFILN